MAATTGTLTNYRAELEAELCRRFPLSAARCARRGRTLLDQTSHAVRWNDPFMVTVDRAQGAAIHDLDGHRLVDWWQGHYANLLGHNPALIRDALAATLASGRGLQTGMLHDAEMELAELVTQRTSTEVVRFTTSGALGTFYAVLLARAFTGRRRIVKVAGGWHGSQPFGLKGVSARGGTFDHVESEGLPGTTGADIEVVPYNDVEALERCFARHGNELACFLVEPWLGAGGGIAGDGDFLRTARRLTERHGALLVSDEIIAGFRFRAGDLMTSCGVRPDLVVLGKILGGGMPVAAVAGRRTVMELCSRGSRRVKFEGGTYSAHELSLVAGLTMVRELAAREQEIYPRIAELGERLRNGLEAIVRELSIDAWISGWPTAVVAGSSLVMLRLAVAGRGGRPANAEAMAVPAGVAPPVDDDLLRATLLLEDVSAHHGMGGASFAHSDADVTATLAGYRRALLRLQAAGLC